MSVFASYACEVIRLVSITSVGSEVVFQLGKLANTQHEVRIMFVLAGKEGGYSI